MKLKVDKSINIDSNNTDQVQKHKGRKIVSWSQEEDDVLREQIRVHGTENWAIIASKFKDKTTRQCRRRWFTYLNSDFKNGGWSLEEDMLLCEAQKIYGNRWTEIAKMVPGRTDNAVKNRFTTLCKKRAKRETLAEENSTKSYINLNNKRVLSHNGYDADGSPKSDEPIKRMRHPLLVAAENMHSCEGKVPTPPHEEVSSDGSTNYTTQGSFLEEDDPKVIALMQQGELLSSLAIKVDTEKTDRSLRNVRLVNDKSSMNETQDCEDYLNENKERKPDVYESSVASSEFSVGSTLLPNTPGDKTEEYEAAISMLQQETGHELQVDQLDHQHCLADAYGIEFYATITEAAGGAVHECSYTEFSSPLHVTPSFTALAAAIPSPHFSESEKHFLMKTLGLMESPSPNPISTNVSHPPTCKRSLLHCL